MKSAASRYTLVFSLFLILSLLILVSDPYFEIKKNFTTFSEVYSEVSRRYVDEVSPEKLIRHGIKSMLELLDPYTVLLDETDNSGLDVLSTGRYSGVGIEIGARNGYIMVVAPLEGSMADQRGIRPGDIIESIDAIPVDNLSVEDVQTLLRGDPGTEIVLSIRRFGIGQPIVFELERELIEVKNVRYAQRIDEQNHIGYIALSRFGQNTAQEIRTAIQELSEGQPLEGLILDLRNNPGGLLDEAVNTVDLFVGPRELVVRTEGRSSENNFRSFTSNPVYYSGPLIILQNSGSASSSEIVSGALQDLDRALVIGDRSFGKGLVQTIRPLSYNLSLKITVSKYFIPSGRSIQAVQYSHDPLTRDGVVSEADRRAFKTRNGRLVYDGVGIDPDIRVSDKPPSMVEMAIRQQNHYMLFANEYQSMHADYDETALPDAVFNAFLNYLERENFEYQTGFGAALEAVKDLLPPGRISDADVHLRELETLLETVKKEQLLAAGNEIKASLHNELMGRYHGVPGRIRASIKNDSLLHSALDHIKNPVHVSVLLSPGSN